MRWSRSACRRATRGSYAALVGGALAGAGGAQLSLSVGGFSADMSSGRGYIALAMVILVGWRPALGALACLAVGVAYAISIQIQLSARRSSATASRPSSRRCSRTSSTLVVLLIYGGGSRSPRASLGKV